MAVYFAAWGVSRDVSMGVSMDVGFGSQPASELKGVD